MSHSAGYVKGIVTGLLFGAAATFLMTPERHEKMRRKLAEGAARLKDKTGSHNDSWSAASGEFSYNTDSDALGDTLEVAAKAGEELQQTHDVVDSI